LTAPNVGVAVAVAAERAARIVQMQGVEPAQPDDVLELVEGRAHGGRAAQVVARREQMASIEADAEALREAGAVQ